MLKLPYGVNCTMLSAYTRDMQLDYEAQEALLDWYRSRGVSSLFAMCHSTELALLSMQERLDLVRFVRGYTERHIQPDGSRMPVIAAGTFSTDIAKMAGEVQAIYDAGADAVVMITNRLDPKNVGGDELIRRAEKLMSLLPKDLPLGFYECPDPYKRVLTLEEMKWAADSGRIHFLKDTCCDPVLIEKRLELVKGKPLLLYNANAQTFLMSLRKGAWGYSSTMANVHPELYVWMCENHEKYPEQAEYLQSILCFTAFSEFLDYPLTAKYLLRRQGVPIEMNSRLCPGKELPPYHRVIMDQLYDLTQRVYAGLPK